MQPLFCALIVFCVLINVPNHKGSPEPIPNAKISIQFRTPFWAVNTFTQTHTYTHAYVYLCICMDIWIYRVAVWDNSMKRVSLQSAKLVAAFCCCSPSLLFCSPPSLCLHPLASFSAYLFDCSSRIHFQYIFRS